MHAIFALNDADESKQTVSSQIIDYIDISAQLDF